MAIRDQISISTYAVLADIPRNFRLYIFVAPNEQHHKDKGEHNVHVVSVEKTNTTTILNID